ncbi:MAG: SDR family NAD(P)-dependent oxidoreductase [Caulobacterales bacterium]
MKIDLSGKTAIITGSTKGIGLATAKGLMAAGATVVINGRSRESVDAAIAEVQSGGAGIVRGVVADMGSEAGCAVLTDVEPKADILINNAFAVAWEDFFETPDAAWNQSWETNVMTAVRLSRHYLRGMESAGWGRLVFISSESARNIQPELISYGATKLALHAVSRGLAKRMAGTGVTANVVLVGTTLSHGVTQMLKPAMDQGMSAEEAGRAFVTANRASSIIQRAATVDEVASMIIYVCSPQASATNGSVLRVDGGIVDDIN